MKCYSTQVIITLITIFVFDVGRTQTTNVPCTDNCIATHWTHDGKCNIAEALNCLKTKCNSEVNDVSYKQTVIRLETINSWCPGNCPVWGTYNCQSEFYEYDAKNERKACDIVANTITCKEDLAKKCAHLKGQAGHQSEISYMNSVKTFCGWGSHTSSPTDEVITVDYCVGMHLTKTCDTNAVVTCLDTVSQFAEDYATKEDFKAIFTKMKNSCPGTVNHCPAFDYYNCKKQYLQYKGFNDEQVCDIVGDSSDCLNGLKSKCPGIASQTVLKNDLAQIRTTQNKCKDKNFNWKVGDGVQCIEDHWSPNVACNINATINCLTAVTTNNPRYTAWKKAYLEMFDLIYSWCPTYVSQGKCPFRDLLQCRNDYQKYHRIDDARVCDVVDNTHTCMKTEGNKCPAMLQDRNIKFYFKGVEHTQTMCNSGQYSAGPCYPDTPAKCLRDTILRVGNRPHCSKGLLKKTLLCLNKKACTGLRRTEIHDYKSIAVQKCPDGKVRRDIPSVQTYLSTIISCDPKFWNACQR